MALPNWVTLIEMLIGCTLYCLSFYFILRILIRLYQAVKTGNWNSSVSPTLLIYFTCWAIQISTGMISNVYVLAMWRPTQTEIASQMNQYLLFWTSIVTVCMSAMIPISVFFLTMERLLTICFPMTYNNKKSRKFACFEVFTISVCFAGNFVAFCTELPLSPKTNSCITWACLFIKTGGVTYTYTKIIAGGLNSVSGAIFVFKFWQANKNAIVSLQSNSRRVNRVALLVIFLEFFLNFVPQLATLLLYQLFGIVVGSIIGPYNLITASLDIFISSIVYSQTGPKKALFQGSSTPMPTTTVNS